MKFGKCNNFFMIYILFFLENSINIIHNIQTLFFCSAKESQGLLPGLCTSHVFCRQCSTDNSSCPSCKTTFNMKNSSVVFSISPEILATLYSLERILKAKPVRECTPAKVPQRKSTSYIPPTGFQQSALATPSPAVCVSLKEK